MLYPTNIRKPVLLDVQEFYTGMDVCPLPGPQMLMVDNSAYISKLLSYSSATASPWPGVVHLSSVTCMQEGGHGEGIHAGPGSRLRALRQRIPGPEVPGCGLAGSLCSQW